jgi:hypothetical protein
MHGMANGLILAFSFFDNKRPKYLRKPPRWLCDVPVPDEEMVADGR